MTKTLSPRRCLNVQRATGFSQNVSVPDLKAQDERVHSSVQDTPSRGHFIYNDLIGNETGKSWRNRKAAPRILPQVPEKLLSDFGNAVVNFNRQ